MKEIMEILTEDLTLEKALRIKESKKKMGIRWVKGTLIPAMLGMVFMMTVIFCAVVITGICEGTLDVKDTEAMTNTVMPIVFLVVGFLLGLMVYQSENETLVNRYVEPVIDKALEELADEDESEDP